ncbi:hypothetical protein VNI00_008482 [Paramarasmius palmivorus]|uniref:F-box domain-containing protein n=1 Tax=Paramarasmius palmivorus TaxID=297713 RepID=A0AAW0CTG4_9AGAR
MNRCEHCPHCCVPAQAVGAVEAYLSQQPKNHVISDSEAPKLNNLIQKAERELEKYGNKLQDLIEASEKEKIRISSAIYQLRAMVKPSIHRLAPEILSLIFTICWEDTREDELWSSKSPIRSMALTFSHVCNRWRALARSLPQIWSHIRLVFEDKCTRVVAVKLHDFMKFCLDKSGEHPLRLSITNDDSLSNLHIPAVRDAFKHCHRWKDVSLSVWDHGDLVDPPNALPLLETLKVHIQPPGPNRFHKHGIATPRLRFLEMSHIQNANLDLKSLSQLTLTGAGYSLSNVLGILQSCRVLRKISFHMFAEDDLRLPEAYSDINSPLESLEVGGFRHGGILFQRITLPHLAHLSVGGYMDRGEVPRFPVTEFCQFLARSQPPLTALHISRLTIEHHRFLDMLASAPSIQILEVVNPSSTYSDLPLIDAFLEQMNFSLLQSSFRLVEQYRDTPLLPNLSELIFDFQFQPFSTRRLYSMLRSRRDKERWPKDCTGQTQLQAFTLKCNPMHLDVYYRSRLEHLEEEGLKMTINYHHVFGL